MDKVRDTQFRQERRNDVCQQDYRLGNIRTDEVKRCREYDDIEDIVDETFRLSALYPKVEGLRLPAPKSQKAETILKSTPRKVAWNLARNIDHDVAGEPGRGSMA